jgi:acyl carrier protein
MLWAEVLRCAEPDPDADFFELGGDSLLVTRLARRLSAELGVRVPLRDLLAARTPGRQAEVVRDLLDRSPVPVPAGAGR